MIEQLIPFKTIDVNGEKLVVGLFRLREEFYQELQNKIGSIKPKTLEIYAEEKVGSRETVKGG